MNQPILTTAPRRLPVMHRALKAGLSPYAARLLRVALEGAEIEGGTAVAIVTAAELGERLGITVRQVQRHAKELREADIPWLAVSSGRWGYAVSVTPDEPPTCACHIPDVPPTYPRHEKQEDPRRNPDVTPTQAGHGTDDATRGRGPHKKTSTKVEVEQQPTCAPEQVLADPPAPEAAAAAPEPSVEEKDPIKSALDECLDELGQEMSGPMRRQARRELGKLGLEGEDILEYTDWVVGTWAEESQNRHVPTLVAMLRDRHARWVRDREAAAAARTAWSKPPTPEDELRPTVTPERRDELVALALAQAKGRF